jgi:hypothetical protein
VGSAPEQQLFTLHHEIFTRRSRFFRVARSERWTPGTKPTELHEHYAGIFNLYVHCVYRNVLPSMEASIFLPPNNGNATDPPQSPEQAQQGEVNRKDLIDLRYEALINLYILADVLLDPTTANMAIDEIRRFRLDVKSNPGAHVITFIYNSTKEGDGLRKVLADFFIYSYTSLYMPKGDVPNDFFKFLMQRYLDGMNKGHITTKFHNVVGKDGWDDLDYYQDVGSDQENDAV